MLVTQMPGLDIFLRRLCSQAQAPSGFTHRRNVQQRAACLLCLLTGCSWTGAAYPFACWVLRQTALARTVTCRFDNPPPPRLSFHCSCPAPRTSRCSLLFSRCLVDCQSLKDAPVNALRPPWDREPRSKLFTSLGHGKNSGFDPRHCAGFPDGSLNPWANCPITALRGGDFCTVVILSLRIASCGSRVASPPFLTRMKTSELGPSR